MLEVIIIVACVLYIVSKFIDKKPKKAAKNSWRNEPKIQNSSKGLTLVESEGDLSAPYAKANELISPLPNVPHKKSSFLTTRNERAFYLALNEALPSGYIVHCQTALMALVQPIERRNNSRTWAKRMDFVITDRETRIVAVIELDDRTHRRESRQKRDRYVNSALDGHHKLIRFQAKMTYRPCELKAVLENELNLCEYENRIHSSI